MRLLIFPLIAILLSSCANLSVHRNDTPQEGEVTEVKLGSFLFGFVPGRRFPPADALCPKGRIESVDFYRTSGDVWLSIVTFSVYVPHRAAVTCAK